MINADTNSGLPIRKEVAKHISELLKKDIGNPSQLFNKYSKDLIEKARNQVASLVDASPSEVVFTSGATESCFLAIMGAFLENKESYSYVTNSTEHLAVSKTFEVINSLKEIVGEEIKSNREGQIDLTSLKLNKPTLLSAMSANNETGIKFDLENLAKKISPQIFFSDVTQTIGKEQFSFKNSSADIIAFSSHKIAGPQGVGALLIKEGTKWSTPVVGGGQQDGRRGGTQASILISAFGLACELKKKELKNQERNSKKNNIFARDLFEQEVLKNLEDIEIIGSKKQRLSNTSMLVIKDVSSVELVKELGKKGVIISAGSACSRGGDSKVLKAMSFNERERRCAVRVSFDMSHGKDEAKKVAKEIISESKRIKSINKKEVESFFNVR